MAALSVSLSAMPVLQARAEPMTIAAGAAVASSVLKLGANKSNVSLEIALAQIEMLRAVHARLDRVEASLAEILKQLSNLPEVVRRIESDQSDIDRSQEVLGILDSLKERLALAKSRKARGVIRDQEIEQNLVNLSNARNTLMHRTDNVAPTLIEAFVTEVTVRKAVGRKADEIDHVLRVYDKRFADILDTNREGSLSWMLAKLRQDQGASERDIATTLGLSDGKVQAGELAWFTHTKMSTKKEKYQGTCYYGGEYGRGEAFDCTQERDVPYPHHSRTWRRSVAMTSNDSELGVFRLRVEPIGPTETPGALDGATQHSQSDAEFESDAMGAHEQLKDTIAIFNKNADAMRTIADTLRLVVVTRQVIQHWDDTAAQQAAAAAKSAGDVGTAIASTEQAHREASAKWLIKEMDTTRIEAWETIQRANERIQKAAKRAHDDKWRADLIALLDVAAASAQMVAAIDAEIAASKLRAAADLTKSVEGIGEPAAPSVDSDNNDQAAATVPQDSTAAVSTNTPEQPLDIRKMTPRQKIDRVMTLAREIKAMPETYEMPPNGFPPRMLKAFEALAILDTMTMTDADRFHAENDKTVGEIIRDAAVDGLLSGGDVTEFQKSIFTSVITPSVIGSGEIESIRTQNALRAELNAEIGRFLQGTNPTLVLDEYIKAQLEQAELCKDGCLQPN